MVHSLPSSLLLVRCFSHHQVNYFSQYQTALIPRPQKGKKKLSHQGQLEEELDILNAVVGLPQRTYASSVILKICF